MKRLLSYISELKGKSIIAPLFKCLESLFELFVPMVISYMIDSGIQKGNTVIIWRSLFLLLLLALIGLSCAIVFCGGSGDACGTVLSQCLIS